MAPLRKPRVASRTEEPRTLARSSSATGAGELQAVSDCRWMDAGMGRGTDTSTGSATTEPESLGIDDTVAVAVATADEVPVQWQPSLLIRGSRPPTPEGDQASGDDVRHAGFALIVLNQPISHYLGIIRRVWKNGGGPSHSRTD